MKGLNALKDIENELQFHYQDINEYNITKFPREINIIEKELKEYEHLKIIEQAQTHGFYFIDYQNNNEIRFSGNTFIRVGNQFVETKPCYEVKETTLYSCYNPLQYPSPSKKVEDAHFWSWKTHLHFRIENYGKTWALTKEELL